MSASLVFDNDIELIDSPGGDYWFELLASTDFGNPQSVEVQLTSLLRDGTIVATQKADNREAVLPIRVRGSDSLALNDGEARLALACGKQTTLVYTPADGIAPPTVFRVLTSSLEAPSDDMAELHNRRTYRLRLVCEPFTRSVTKIVDSAGTPPSSGGTVVYAAESTTGWSKWAYTAGAAAVVDTTVHAQGTGSIRVEAGAGGDGTTSYGNQVTSGYSGDQVTGLAVSTGTGGYLSVKVRTEFTETMYDNYGSQLISGVTHIWTQVSGVWTEVPTFTAADTDASGWTRYVWPVAASVTVTGFRFQVQQYKTGWGWGLPDVWYDDFELLPAATTDNQIVKVLDIKGSARTPGSLHIAAPSDSVALGQVLAVTVPSDEIQPGFQPDVRRWVVSGSTTTDTTALHGSFYDIPSAYSASPVFEIPVSTLRPGPYSVVALVKDASGPLSAQAQLVIGGTTVGPASEAALRLSASVTSWSLVALGTAYLPPLPMQNADATAKVRVRVQGLGKIADLYVIPLAADFSIVDCGTGTVSAALASSHLWLDSPDPSQPQGGWWRGPVAARGLARSAWPDVKKPAQHTFKPGSLTAFLVSTGAQGPTLTLEYFPSWHTNAGL